ncbi:hypothetical protein SAMN06295974_1307 [Plantibacter flavus]|uniref:Uncharacterized protein n=1 Tax=Plantibacter flavus TaxID=150123 RepID=A0A3N2C6U9_9MICO|nr:hypothetical protein EDD42_3352 [Plantibacter flavus]SMG21838.1 hypothetical protein SAMN06295974_1307 [Plantibacter flavus]
MDSLVELQKYQEVVRIAAAAEWRHEHPNEDLPLDFEKSVSLTIEEIREGSADVFLIFEQHETYARYQTEAQNAADSMIAAAYRGEEVSPIPALSPRQDFEFRSALAQFGQTLGPAQSIEFFSDGPKSAPVRITVETRKDAVDRLLTVDRFLLPPNEAPPTQDLKKEEQSLVGHVTELNADNTTYVLVLPDGRQLKGFYRDRPGLLEDLKLVLNSAAEGPLTRITGELTSREGQPWRFWHTSSLEQIQFDGAVWGARLAELAALAPHWNGAAAAQVSSVALEGAQMVLREVDKANIARPGIFPTEEGGVLIEWSSPAAVRSVEVLQDGTFETFELASRQSHGVHSTTSDLKEAIAFLRAAEA